MKKEYSAGVIVYKLDPHLKSRLYLLLLYRKDYWDLPKGKIEGNETKLETAKRELKEETNLEAKIYEGFEEALTYFFRGLDKELIHKEVTFFVGQALDSRVILSNEHLDYIWLPYNEAMKKLTYQNARSMLQKANDFLSSND